MSGTDFPTPCSVREMCESPAAAMIMQHVHHLQAAELRSVQLLSLCDHVMVSRDDTEGGFPPPYSGFLTAVSSDAGRCQTMQDRKVWLPEVYTCSSLLRHCVNPHTRIPTLEV